MIVYPMGLPAHEEIDAILKDEEELAGTQVPNEKHLLLNARILNNSSAVQRDLSSLLGSQGDHLTR